MGRLSVKYECNSCYLIWACKNTPNNKHPVCLMHQNNPLITCYRLASDHRPPPPNPPPSLQKHQFLQISPSRTLSADFDSIWTSVLGWEGGSTVKRITQNSPTRCSLTPCQLFSSIRPSIVPSLAPSSFHLPVCSYLCLYSSFHPCQEDYIVSPSRFPFPSPLFSLLTTLPPFTT